MEDVMGIMMMGMMTFILLYQCTLTKISRNGRNNFKNWVIKKKSMVMTFLKKMDGLHLVLMLIYASYTKIIMEKALSL